MFGISKAEIEQKIKNRLLEELSKSGRVELKGVGTLSQTSDGDLKFYASQDFLNALHRMQRK